MNGGGVGSLKHLLKRYDTTVDPVIGEKVIVQDVATKQWKKTAIVTGIRLVADKTIASYEIDINGLETTNSSVRLQQYLNQQLPDYTQQGGAGEQDRMFNSLCSCLTIIMVYAVVISLAFIVVSALYATASPGFNCESVKKVGKV